MEGNAYLIYLAVFLLVFLPYALMSFFMGKEKSRKTGVDVQSLPFFFRMVWWLIPYFSDSMNWFSTAISEKKRTEIENTLLVANLKLGINELLSASLLLSVLFSSLATLICLAISKNGGVIAVCGVIAFILGFCYPYTTVQDIASKRQLKIMRSLPFAIDLIGSAMRSGVDFSAAIRYYVSMESEKNPLAVEFGVMLRQLDLGKTRVQAIEDMAKHVQTDEFTSFAAAVAHSFEVGSPLVETLKIQASEMRRVRFNIAERKAARAVSAMIFPIAVFIMPAMFLIIGTPIFIQVFSSGLIGVFKK